MVWASAADQAGVRVANPGVLAAEICQVPCLRPPKGRFWWQDHPFEFCRRASQVVKVSPLARSAQIAEEVQAGTSRGADTLSPVQTTAPEQFAIRPHMQEEPGAALQPLCHPATGRHRDDPCECAVDVSSPTQVLQHAWSSHSCTKRLASAAIVVTVSARPLKAARRPPFVPVGDLRDPDWQVKTTWKYSTGKQVLGTRSSSRVRRALTLGQCRFYRSSSDMRWGRTWCNPPHARQAPRSGRLQSPHHLTRRGYMSALACPPRKDNGRGRCQRISSRAGATPGRSTQASFDGPGPCSFGRSIS